MCAAEDQCAEVPPLKSLRYSSATERATPFQPTFFSNETKSGHAARYCHSRSMPAIARE